MDEDQLEVVREKAEKIAKSICEILMGVKTEFALLSISLSFYAVVTSASQQLDCPLLLDDFIDSIKKLENTKKGLSDD